MKTLLSTFVLAFVATTAGAGYVYDTAGTHVRDSAGDCVVDSEGAPAVVPAECGGPGAREITVLEDGVVTVAAVNSYDTVANFAFDSSALDQEARDRLALFAETQVPEGAVVVVVGHTDAVGTEDYNDALGLSRANAAAQYLSGLGVTVLDVVSRGETELLVGTQRANRDNRRVQVDVVIE